MANSRTFIIVQFQKRNTINIIGVYKTLSCGNHYTCTGIVLSMRSKFTLPNKYQAQVLNIITKQIDKLC